MYTVEFTSRAEKDLGKLPKQIIAKILEKVDKLSDDPRPSGYKKLTDFHVSNAPDELYRIRIGNYRVIYSIEDEIITITIVKVAHRKEVYE
jgi:mRNA interferase RelE/StbE